MPRVAHRPNFAVVDPSKHDLSVLAHNLIAAGADYYTVEHRMTLLDVVKANQHLAIRLETERRARQAAEREARRQ